MAILKGFPGTACSICGKSPRYLLIDSPVPDLCEACYGADEIVIDRETDKKVAVQMKWREERVPVKLLHD